LKILKEYLNKNLKRKYIQHFINPAGALILFILKKNGSFRLYVNYRNLNKITIKNRHSLPLIREILDRLNGAAVYTKFDFKKAYYRIRIKKEGEWKTIFKIRYGYFKYKVIFLISLIYPQSFKRILTES
jgi:hypothetical protein